MLGTSLYRCSVRDVPTFVRDEMHRRSPENPVSEKSELVPWNSPYRHQLMRFSGGVSGWTLDRLGSPVRSYHRERRTRVAITYALLTTTRYDTYRRHGCVRQRRSGSHRGLRRPRPHAHHAQRARRYGEYSARRDEQGRVYRRPLRRECAHSPRGEPFPVRRLGRPPQGEHRRNVQRVRGGG